MSMKTHNKSKPGLTQFKLILKNTRMLGVCVWKLKKEFNLKVTRWINQQLMVIGAYKNSYLLELEQYSEYLKLSPSLDDTPSPPFAFSLRRLNAYSWRANVVYSTSMRMVYIYYLSVLKHLRNDQYIF